eukprot:801983_1
MSYLDATIGDQDLIEDVGITVQSHRETILNAIKSLLQPPVRPETNNQQEKPPQELKANESNESDDDAEVSHAINIVDELVDLGSTIGRFPESEKKKCFDILEYILHLDEITVINEPKVVGFKEQEAKAVDVDEEDMKLKGDDMSEEEVTIVPTAASKLEEILNPISQDKSAKFIDCVQSFLRIIGFQADYLENKGFEIKGAADLDSLNEVGPNFYKLSNAMQKPKMNVYQQLNIRIPNDGSVVKHKSGLYDNEFITFLLPQIVMENQQSSLVNKVTLDPAHLERFINFL